METYKMKTVKFEDKNIVTCSKCGRNFPTEQGLKIHVKKMHTDDEKSMCKLCKNCYQSSDELNQHMENAHEKIGSPESKKLRLNSKSAKEIEIQVCEKDFEVENDSKSEVEEMEIDIEDEAARLSRLNDEKILQKQKLNDKQEAIQKIEAYKKLEGDKKRKRQISIEKKKKKKIAKKENSIENKKN